MQKKTLQTKNVHHFTDEITSYKALFVLSIIVMFSIDQILLLSHIKTIISNLHFDDKLMNERRQISPRNQTHRSKKKKQIKISTSLHNAEAGGFEPPVRLPVRQFSKLVVSATHPNFLTALFFSNALQNYNKIWIYKVQHLLFLRITLKFWCNGLFLGQ